MTVRNALALVLVLGTASGARAGSRVEELRTRVRAPLARETIFPDPGPDGAWYFGTCPDGKVLFRNNVDIMSNLHSVWWTYDVGSRSLVSRTHTTEDCRAFEFTTHGGDPSWVFLSYQDHPDASTEKRTEIRNVRTGEVRKAMPSRHLHHDPKRWVDILMSHDSTRVLHVEAPGKTLAIFDIASGSCRPILQDDATPTSYAWSPDGRAVAVARAGLREVILIDTGPASPAFGEPMSTMPVPWFPRYLSWKDGKRLLVTTEGADGALFDTSVSPPAILVRRSAGAERWVYDTATGSKRGSNLYHLLDIKPPLDSMPSDPIPGLFERGRLEAAYTYTYLPDGWMAHGVGNGPFGRQLDRSHGLIVITDAGGREVLVIDGLQILAEEEAVEKLRIWTRFEWFVPVDGGDRVLAFLSNGRVLTFETDHAFDRTAAAPAPRAATPTPPR